MNVTLNDPAQGNVSGELQLSVIIPVYNEEDNFLLISTELLPVLAQSGYSYEIIFVDDGSTDNSYDAMRQFKENNPETKIIRLRTNKGKSEALSAGFESASGNMVVTIDADLQESPREILTRRSVFGLISYSFSIRSMSDNLK